jgi:hypothetical protein
MSGAHWQRPASSDQDFPLGIAHFPVIQAGGAALPAGFFLTRFLSDRGWPLGEAGVEEADRSSACSRSDAARHAFDCAFR